MKLNSKLYQDEVKDQINAMKSKDFSKLKVELIAPELGVEIKKSAKDIT